MAIQLDGVSNVTGVENFALLPPSSSLNVQRNRAFPREVRQLFTGRGWYIAPYSATNRRAGKPADRDADGVDYFPFVLSIDSGDIELFFDNWDLIDPLVAAVAPKRTSNEIVEAVMGSVVAELGLEATDDSEAESVRLRFVKRDDAVRAAQALRMLWLEGDNHESFLYRGLEAARG